MVARDGMDGQAVAQRRRAATLRVNFSSRSCRMSRFTYTSDAYPRS